jgi:hypothetical protein
VKGNPMHEAHLAGGNDCGDCHDPEYPLDHTQSLASCGSCHDKTVVKPVWENHCLTCHHFTYSDETAATDPVRVGELCHDCHYGEEADQTIYAFIHPDELHNITCERCHQPHTTEQAASAEFCESCHPELVGIKHPTVGTTTCEQCHNPHLGGSTGAQICTSCHVPDDRVLVHLVPSHPDDCLVCHSPHFDETEILGSSCLDCHDGMYYAGGDNQPAEHKHCENCHWVSDFQYKSDHVCGECHVDQGWVIENTDLPAQHRNCLTCHHPHTWRAPFKENCVSCHDIDQVLEHKLEFHQFACDECHDPHLTDEMPKSGNCTGCHGPQIPVFMPDAPSDHVDCHHCHRDWTPGAEEFVFRGETGTCVVCHTKPFSEHEHDWDNLPAQHRECNHCHPAHHFPDVQTPEESCRDCHAGLFSAAASTEHQDCFNCHSHDHSVEYKGQKTTCVICHSDAAVSGAHTSKTQCLNCHDPHSFTAQVNCLDCHLELRDEVAAVHPGDCEQCHGGHTWKPDRETCITCHDQLSEAHRSVDYKYCNDCHQAHSFEVSME